MLVRKFKWLMALLVGVMACGDDPDPPGPNNFVITPDASMNNNLPDMDTSDMPDMPATPDMALPQVGLVLTPRPLVIRRGEQFRISAEIQGGAEAIEIESIEYTSQNPAIATVDSTGLVLGVAAGEVQIQAVANSVYSSSLPVRVYALYDSLALGRSHTCASKVDGRVVCWGDNAFKQAGGSDSTPFLEPKQVEFTGTEEALDAFAGFSHNCATFTGNNGARCWGNNRNGELGDDSGGDRGIGTQPLNFSVPVREAALGDGFTCLRLDNKQLRCFGSNRDRIIEDSTVATIREPRPVHEMTTFRSIAAGRAHMCGIREDFKIVCWGANDQGQLGPMGPNNGSFAPIPLNNTNYTMIDAFGDHTCAFSPFTGVTCWGASQGGFGNVGTTQTDSPVAVDLPMGEVRAIAVGQDHACALVGTTVHCWGRNDSGQLGDQTTDSRADAAPVFGSDGLSPLACGANHCCGVSGSGDMFCWGANAQGQVGDGSTTDRRVPTYIFPTAF